MLNCATAAATTAATPPPAASADLQHRDRRNYNNCCMCVCVCVCVCVFVHSCPLLRAQDFGQAVSVPAAADGGSQQAPGVFERIAGKVQPDALLAEMQQDHLTKWPAVLQAWRCGTFRPPSRRGGPPYVPSIRWGKDGPEPAWRHMSQAEAEWRWGPQWRVPDGLCPRDVSRFNSMRADAIAELERAYIWDWDVLFSRATSFNSDWVDGAEGGWFGLDLLTPERVRSVDARSGGRGLAALNVEFHRRKLEDFHSEQRPNQSCCPNPAPSQSQSPRFQATPSSQHVGLVELPWAPGQLQPECHPTLSPDVESQGAVGEQLALASTTARLLTAEQQKVIADILAGASVFITGKGSLRTGPRARVRTRSRACTCTRATGGTTRLDTNARTYAQRCVFTRDRCDTHEGGAGKTVLLHSLADSAAKRWKLPRPSSGTTCAGLAMTAMTTTAAKLLRGGSSLHAWMGWVAGAARTHTRTRTGPRGARPSTPLSTSRPLMPTFTNHFLLCCPNAEASIARKTWPPSFCSARASATRYVAAASLP